ncbi:MAG: tetratricopeptide repeat protein [bacterium]|nr:tetratricopeptide repeat protein [bacterium]
MRLASVLTYLPADRRFSLANGPPLASEGEGAVLYADISGFTPLTESLARTFGARLGAEELTRQLNRVYDALVQQTDTFGGSILGFSGDAITCWFGGDEAPDAIALRAVTCAFALQDAMAHFAEVPLPNGDTVPLSLKTAVASGVTRRFLVGDPDIQLLDVMAGDTLTRMAEAEHYASKGEVVIDQRTADLLKQDCIIAEWRMADNDLSQKFARVATLKRLAAPKPWPALAFNALTIETVRSWLLPALYEREDESLPELRPAVAVFLHFSGIDFEGDSQAETQLDGYIRWVQRVVARYDGALLQLTIGEKGSYMYMTFGAPLAHENNPERAAAAALELRTPPEDLAYIRSIHIGISQGMMRAGAYGGATRRTYGVLGDDVNLAARLMQHAAPGEILMSERVYKAVARSFVIEPLPPIRVKGKQEPLSIARLQAKADEQAREAAETHSRPLVGRSHELQQLIRHLEPVVRRQAGGCIWVHGEPGIGKSHLIQAVRKRLTDLDGVMWLRFSTDQLVRQSLHPFIPVLVDYFNLDLADNDTQKKALFNTGIDALIEVLETSADPRAPGVRAALEEHRWFIGALLGLRWPGSAYENYDPKLRYQRSLSGLNMLLQAESLSRPVIIQVQDAQWLDSDSRIVVEHWIETAKTFPCALIIDSRDKDTDFDLFLEDGDPLLAQLQVRELDTAGINELLTLVLNAPVSDRLCRYVTSKANGNPFFTEQLALDLSERGALMRLPDDQWDMNPETVNDIPATINAVLIARLDRLIVQVRSIVQIASVLGQEFEVPVLARMMRDDPDIQQRVKQAEAETIWVARSEWDYLFRHALLRDAAYSMQLQERLRELHALAGWAIEQVHSANLVAKSSDIAYHYEKSAIFDRAVIYLIKSAQHMASLYANREAMGYYQRAIMLLERATLPPFEVAPLYEGMADLYEAAGEYQSAVNHYDAALALVDTERAAWRTTLHRKKGQVLQKWGRYDEAVTVYEAGLVELQGELNPDEACQIYTGLSMINYRQGKIEDAAELAMLALMMAQMDNNRRNLAHAHQTLGVLHWKNGDYAQAVEENLRSLALWEETRSTLGLAAVQNNLGLVRCSMGDIGTAIRHFEQSLAAFEQVGNLHGLACAYDNLGQAYMQQGEQALAMQCLEKAVGILATIGLDDSQVFSSMWQSGTW